MSTDRKYRNVLIVICLFFIYMKRNLNKILQAKHFALIIFLELNLTNFFKAMIYSWVFFM